MEKLAYSPHDAAQALGVSRATIWRLIRQGTVIGVHVGRRLLIPRQELEKILTINKRGETLWRTQ